MSSATDKKKLTMLANQIRRIALNECADLSDNEAAYVLSLAIAKLMNDLADWNYIDLEAEA